MGCGDKGNRRVERKRKRVKVDTHTHIHARTAKHSGTYDQLLLISLRPLCVRRYVPKSKRFHSLSSWLLGRHCGEAASLPFLYRSACGIRSGVGNLDFRF